MVDQWLEELERRRTTLREDEADSLRSALARLRVRSIGQSIGDLSVGLDAVDIDENDIGRLRGRCYAVRSQLVHEGIAREGTEPAQMAGSLFFLLRHLIRRIDELAGA